MKDTKHYIYAVGRRKESTATVKLFPQWSGDFFVRSDEKQIDLKDYFAKNFYLYENAMYPFHLLGHEQQKKFDGELAISWGGIMGQAEAIRLAFSRALTKLQPERRVQLKPHGLLKRDPRQKERMKPWLKKARKAPQRSKR